MTASKPPLNAPAPSTPWHRGEQLLQARLGVAGRMAEIGHKALRDHMPEQHRSFYEQLPFMILGAVDASGAPWASVLEGLPGFVASPDPKHLRIRAMPANGDPLHAALAPGAAVGLLGIELPTRRRNRMNGNIVTSDADGFEVAVGQSFGNCPKYIQTREPSFARAPSSSFDGPIERGRSLDDAARSVIAAADTFFVASYVDADEDASRRAVDVSHRGGKPGFVRIEGDVLTIPDFAGNLFFNTLGNLVMNPRAGLLFIDFESGSVLQLTGTTEILFEGPELASFQGAERLWRFQVEETVRRRGAMALRFRFGEYSPAIP